MPKAPLILVMLIVINFQSTTGQTGWIFMKLRIYGIHEKFLREVQVHKTFDKNNDYVI